MVGGANVYPAEVEAALQEHGDVHSAVVGLPGEDLGSGPPAIVHLTGEVDDDALRAHLRDRLVPDKWPRRIKRVDAPMRDDANMVRRSALVSERSGAERTNVRRRADAGRDRRAGRLTSRRPLRATEQAQRQRPAGPRRKTVQDT